MSQSNSVKEEKIESINRTGKNEEFTEDQLRMNWRQFAFKARDENQKTLHAAMIDRDPVLKSGFEISYTVANNIQLEFIETHKIDLLGYLREKLKNDELKITLTVESEASTAPTTSKDKFKEMAKQNPELNNLRKRFKLDFDY